MSARWRQMGVVAATTVASRVLGLLRDTLTFALLGAGSLSSAFVLAFMLPNLFRRLLGEGALTSAVVPVLSQVEQAGGAARLHRLLAAVLAQLARVTLWLMAASIALLWGLVSWNPQMLPERYYLAGELTIWMLPYLSLVCLAAIAGAALNVRGKFAIHGLSQVWLNLSMALSLGGLGYWLAPTVEARVGWLVGGVLAGGALQLLVPMVVLWREGWRPVPLPSEEQVDLRRIWRLFLPGLMGASALQVNIMIARFLSFSVNDAAAGVLYLAHRLVELPLGVFALAVSTVLFPEMSRLAGQPEQRAAYARTYQEGCRLIWLITAPAAVGLVVLAEPILQALFGWGLFAGEGVALTVEPLQILALGLPFMAISPLALRALHAREDMQTPMRLAWTVCGLKVGLGVALMVPFGVNGLALAGVLTALGYYVLLHRAVALPPPDDGPRPIWGRWLGAAAVMGLTLAFIQPSVSGWTAGVLGVTPLAAGVQLLGLIPLGGALYFALLWWWQVPEVRRGSRLLRRFRRTEQVRGGSKGSIQ